MNFKIESRLMVYGMLLLGLMINQGVLWADREGFGEESSFWNDSRPFQELEKLDKKLEEGKQGVNSTSKSSIVTAVFYYFLMKRAWETQQGTFTLLGIVNRSKAHSKKMLQSKETEPWGLACLAEQDKVLPSFIGGDLARAKQGFLKIFTVVTNDKTSSPFLGFLQFRTLLFFIYEDEATESVSEENRQRVKQLILVLEKYLNSPTPNTDERLFLQKWLPYQKAIFYFYQHKFVEARKELEIHQREANGSEWGHYFLWRLNLLENHSNQEITESSEAALKLAKQNDNQAFLIRFKKELSDIETQRKKR